MPDIKLRDGSGVEQVYEGVDTITVPLADGSGTFTYGLTDEQLNLSDGQNHYYTFAKGSPLYKEDYFKDNYIIKRANMNNVGSGNITGSTNLFLQGLFKDNTYVTDLSDVNISGAGLYNMGNMFDGCTNLLRLPNFSLRNVGGNQSTSLFHNCISLQNGELEKFFENVELVNNFQSGPISYCYSITSLDLSAIERVSPLFFNSTSWAYNKLIGYMDNLRELKLPGNTIYGTNALTSSSYALSSYIVNHPFMLSSLTFSTNEDGTPYKARWKGQSYKLTNDAGYITSNGPVIKGTCPPDPTHNVFYNISSTTGLTEEKLKEEYDRVKGFDDWHSYKSGNMTYKGTNNVGAARLVSRFNHDSIVGFINTLPDTSEYLATAGGTNTIQLDRFQGDLTDGGGVSDLTEAEIAVAASKGWTVSIV